MLPFLGSSLPQIFLQGLLIRCHREGVLHSQLLPEPIALECIELAEREGVQLTGARGAVLAWKRG